MKTAISVFAALVSLSTAGQAQPDGPTPPRTLPSPPANYCVFADRLYSPGAYLCVAAGTVMKCDASGKAWVAEASPTCLGPNNPPPK